MRNRWITTLALCGALVGAAACEESTEAEVEEAAEAVGDDMETTAEEAAAETEQAAEAAGAEMEAAGEEMEGEIEGEIAEERQEEAAEEALEDDY